MERIRSLNRILKSYDRELYAQCTKLPRIDVYRRNRDGLSAPHFVFALTDNWSVSGRPVEWGLEVVIQRLKAIDLWNNGETFEDLEKQYEAKAERGAKHLRNDIESFLGEFRRQFARATDSINTGTMDKKTSRKGY